MKNSNLKMKSLILYMLTSMTACAAVIDLQPFEKKVYSQNGEDGITLKIFECIGTTNKYYVEFGVENGDECNTRVLREHHGWQGLMMDGNHQNDAINLRQEFITVENINHLFQKYQVPKEFDLLSIDIDFNDFYIWNTLISKYRPRVVIIEHNATHLPDEDKVVIYHPTQTWDETNYFGASLLALKNLGNKHGYTLVYADNRGVNLFFVRTDILTDLNCHFKDENDEVKLYKAPSYSWGPNGGHPEDPLFRKFITSLEADCLIEDNKIQKIEENPKPCLLRAYHQINNFFMIKFK